MFLFAAIAVDGRFAHGLSDDLVHGLSIGWRARQDGDVDHSDDWFEVGEKSVSHHFTYEVL
jgi:hypothetical protein